MKPHYLSIPLAAALAALPAARAADATALWVQNCAACHGKDGAGHTRAGRMAGVKNLTDPAFQQTFTDADATARIKGGLKDKSGKVRMKAFGDTLSDAQIADLVGYVRALRK